MPTTGKKDDQITKLLRYDRLYQELSQQRSVEEMQELCDQRDLDYGEFAAGESLIILFVGFIFVLAIGSRGLCNASNVARKANEIYGVYSYMYIVKSLNIFGFLLFQMTKRS